ncbi:aspartoacylase [Nitratiruptor sp. SB155-2]|uniref:aspartoacylase n=1 Tax=Nitratiruptor sp. (strain SB155-2) TaxID=387092 RepID=UPI00015870A1|nr:aspartoacylase [Nitratiruptor sp. SB155-2]BAF69999.1 aspartoacylase [Nitratiruptor sp. SB155-2]
MKVTISGGVHGNELTGVYIVKKLMHDDFQVKNLQLDFLLANPKAIKECRRYVDKDLNRSFSKDALQSDEPIYEYERAKVITQKLQDCDFLIDLHTTTANMGITIVLSNQDSLSENVAKILASEYENVRILQWLSNDEGAFINSIVPSSITIEVGPVCQGVLDANLYFQTLKVVKRAIDILEKEEALQEKVQAFRIYDAIDFPRKDRDLNGMIHPELAGKDYQLLHPGDPIFLTFDEREIFYEGKEAYPVFINEAAYYEKGMAFCLSESIFL